MIKTKRWDEPREADDGFRLLICRYRPRALPKKKETWDLWWSQLGPSKELHAAFYGKHGQLPIRLDEYTRRYLDEMKGPQQQESIAVLAEQVAAGKTITLLCSSACTDPTHCHRSLLKQLIEEQLAQAEQGGISPLSSAQGALGEEQQSRGNLTPSPQPLSEYRGREA